MKLEDIIVYNLSMTIAEKVWNIASKWNTFERSTIGIQWIRAVDSVGANISEGYGRYYFKDSKMFLYFARGSLMESITWLNKAHNRGLIEIAIFEQLAMEMKVLSVKLNNYIKSTGSSQEASRQ